MSYLYLTMRTLKNFVLVRSDLIHDEFECLESKETIVAEGKTIAGLVKFARLKKLDEDYHYIEANYVEDIGGYLVPDSEMVGYLGDPKRIAEFRP